MRLLLFIVTSALLFLTACKSASSFESPNNLRNITGTLYLTSGSTVEGKLIVNTNNAFGSQVKMFLPGEKKAQKYDLHDVEGYNIRGEYYELKEVKGGISIGRNLSFMKRLTPQDSRIHLYENMEVNNSTTTNRNGTTATNKRYDIQYYMQFPSETGDGVWAANSSKFVPNFEEKMSKLVADCPALAAKISNKESGYFYAQVTVFKEKRAEVLWNIISEYNKCK